MKVPRARSPSKANFFRFWMWLLRRTGKGRNMLLSWSKLLPTVASEVLTL